MNKLLMIALLLGALFAAVPALAASAAGPDYPEPQSRVVLCTATTVDEAKTVDAIVADLLAKQERFNDIAHLFAVQPATYPFSSTEPCYWLLGDEASRVAAAGGERIARYKTEGRGVWAGLVSVTSVIYTDVPNQYAVVLYKPMPLADKFPQF